MKASFANMFGKSALAGLVAIGSVLASTSCETKKGAAQAQLPTPEVSVLAIKTEEAVLTETLPGRVAALLVADVRPQVGGIIQKRLFEEGADVKEGDVLYKIDDSLYKAAYDKAQADLAKAEASIVSIRKDYERYKKLVETSAVSQMTFDEADSNLRTAEADILAFKAALETAKINLAYTKITAPISGRIGRSQITVGALVAANNSTALATIQTMDPIYVDVTQSSASLLRLKDEMTKGRLNCDEKERTIVKLLLEDGSVYPQTGFLQFRDITIDQSTGSFILRIVFPNPNKILLPGMFVQAVLETGVDKRAIEIPQQTVSRDMKGRPLALVVSPEGKIEQRMLDLGPAMKDKWIVKGGLNAGDRIVVEGLQKVRPGLVVKAIPFVEDQAPSANQPLPSSSASK